jgi:hypothetical protein
MNSLRLTGKVIDRETGHGVPGLRVETWDKDLICNDLVGTAMTDDQGTFQIEFDQSDFQDLFLDRQPDLFFRVFRENQLIKSTEDSVLWNVNIGERKMVIEVDTPVVNASEKDRQQFKALLLSNPNYFGNIVNSPLPVVKKMVGNTYWEELTCVGFNPELAQLEAIVSIKQTTGYSGGLCTNGSTEYVRFFIDWGDGNGFQDVGLASFKAYDISDLPPGPQHPLKYMVYLPLDDVDHVKGCDKPVLPKVRAVLSWNQIPSLDPEEPPVFGNRLDVEIQLRKADVKISDLIKGDLLPAELNLLETVDIEAVLPQVKPQPVPWSKLIDQYKKAEVPDHRLVYNAVYPLLKGGNVAEKVLPQTDLSLVESLQINLSEVIEALQIEDQANTTYEELVCLGLGSAHDLLGAVIHVKKPYGYSGDLCQAGSTEYVAFWADWNNNGIYDEYLGMATVQVYDIPSIPAGGLYYGVLLPVNLTQQLQTCKKPNIVRIRAVLSWATPPSTTDPNDLNYWGNRLDALVQVRPGIASDDLLDLIYDVGNVAIDNISTATYLAYPSAGVLDPANCSQPAMDRPFGGRIKIGGRIYNTGTPGTVHYQVQYKLHSAPDTDWAPVAHSHKFELMHPDPFDPLYPKEVVTINSPDGWFPYLENPLASPPIHERTNRLAWWNTGSLEGEYDLRLAYTKDYPIASSSYIHYSNIVTIVLDNTNYRVSPDANTEVDTAYTLDLVIDGGDCHSYAKGSTIEGHLRAVDQYFWKWVLELQPETHTNGTQAIPPCRSYDSLLDLGYSNYAWTLHTTNLDKCGYTLTLKAYDRTIINSNGAIVHWNKKAVGFSVV